MARQNDRRCRRQITGIALSRRNQAPSVDFSSDALERMDVGDRRLQNDDLIVAAIDLGTTYSGYCFSFRHEYATNPLTIHANAWENASGGTVNMKTPSCLLLHPNRELHSFGFEAKQKYETLSEVDEHKDWYFFWQFKMTLHQKKEIQGSYFLTEENGKKLPAMDVFSLSIRYLKDHFLLMVRNATPDMRDKDIRWVITVPAIWKESAKKFMRKSAEMAGINKDQLTIALEPEAASLYCRQLPMTREPTTAQGMTKFPVGTKYMVLDCGGGTVDVTVHEVKRGGRLKELHVATGGDWGGTKVNKSFWSFVANLVGPPIFHEFSENCKADYLSILEEFENKKRAQKPESADTVAIRIPISLQKLFRDKKAKELAQVSMRSDYRDNVSIVGDKMRITADAFKSFFKDAVDDIVRHVGNLLRSLDCDLSAILMVGGFSESPILQKAMRDAFGSHMDVLIPMEASMTVLKGAVLYGHEPRNVSSRRCPCTYGIMMTHPFNSRLHEARKRITIDGEDLCDDLFDKHVEVGQKVATGQTGPEKKYYPLTATDRILPVVLYKSTEPNPMYVDDAGCECVGKFLITLPESRAQGRHRSVRVKMIFGGTEITVQATEASGQIHTADFSFD